MFKIILRVPKHLRIASHYPASTLLLERKFVVQDVPSYSVVPTCSIIPKRTAATNSANQYIKELVRNGTWSLKNRLKKAGIFGKSRLTRNGYILYTNIADNFDYKYFFKKFDLPDTFNSWFVVMELHMWIVLVRLMAEAEEGRFVRNIMIEAMWEDVRFKAGLLGEENSSIAKGQIKIISEEFQAALLSYDEGLLSDDIVLAGALWRRFFNKDCNDPVLIELLVSYIRRQVRTFDLLSREDVLESPKLTWLLVEEKL